MLKEQSGPTAVGPEASVAFAIPGDIDTATGGYGYARHLLTGLPGLRVGVDHVPLPGSFPFPTPNDLAETERLFAKLPISQPLLIDGLAYGAFPEALAASLPNPVIALVHHPLALESGLAADQSDALRRLERAALAHADRVITSSDLTARELAANYDVSLEKITVAEPGAPAPRRATGSNSPTVHVLAVGAISERKGYDVLVAALALQADLDWRLTIAGDDQRNPTVVAALRSQVANLGFGATRVRLAGAVSDRELDQLYDQADAFVLSSRYEGYGMVLTEAIARGLAIVSTTGGAAAETVPDGVALKVAPDDVAALSDSLGRVISDTPLRGELSAAAWEYANRLPTWDGTCRAVANVVREVS